MALNRFIIVENFLGSLPGARFLQIFTMNVL